MARLWEAGGVSIQQWAGSKNPLLYFPDITNGRIRGANNNNDNSETVNTPLYSARHGDRIATAGNE